MNAYLKAMRSFADYRSRSGRAEYWYFMLVLTCMFLVALVIGEAINAGGRSGDNAVLGYLLIVIHLPPLAAVSVRRLHDVDKSGWWFVLNFIPIGQLFLLIFYCQPSTPGPNRFGPMPMPSVLAPTRTGLATGTAGPVSAQPVVHGPDTSDQILARLEKLANLRASGAITDAEFDRLKAATLQ